MRYLVAVLMGLVLTIPSFAQDNPPVVEMKRPKATAFQSSLGKAISVSRKKGEISARQALKLRVALISPAFRQKAEDLAVTQMAFSGTDEPLPLGEDGKVNRAAIDWGSLLVFLEKLLPYLLQLLELFSANASATFTGVALC